MENYHDSFDSITIMPEDDKVLSEARYLAQSAAQKFNKAEETATEWSPGNRYEWSNLNELVAADVALKFWQQVVAGSSPSEDDMWITKEVLAASVKQAYRHLVQNQGGSSSDPFARARADVEREFYSRIVRSFEDLTR